MEEELRRKNNVITIIEQQRNGALSQVAGLYAELEEARILIQGMADDNQRLNTLVESLQTKRKPVK